MLDLCYCEAISAAGACEAATRHARTLRMVGLGGCASLDSRQLEAILEACKRIGAVYTCLPESISVGSLAGRVFDLSAKLVITSSAKSAVDGSSHKAMVSAAVMDFVSMEAALREPDGRVLVHCEAGQSRSATVVIAALMANVAQVAPAEALGVDEALAVVAAQRPNVRPNDGFKACLRRAAWMPTAYPDFF